MRTTRFLGALLALFLPVSLLTAAPASAATIATQVGIERAYKLALFQDNTGPAGTRDTGLFRATLSDGATAIADQPVTLERRLVGRTDFVALETLSTDANGQTVFETPAVANAFYRFRFDGAVVGADELAASVSSAMPFNVMRDLNARKVTKSGRIYLKGNVNPGWNKKTISFQRKACSSCGWTTIAKKKTSAYGGWRFQASYPPVGKVWKFRAVVPKTAAYVKSYSAVLTTKTVRR